MLGLASTSQAQSGPGGIQHPNTYRYRVLNAYGQALRTGSSTGAELAAGVQLSALPAGPYLVEVQAADGSARTIQRAEIR